MSDFNSRLGKGRFEDLVSLFELGNWEKQEMREENDSCILPGRRHESYQHMVYHLGDYIIYMEISQRQSRNINRNQIDFILINKYFRSSINKVST